MSNLDEFNSLKSSYNISGSNYKGVTPPPMPTPMPTPIQPLPVETIQYKVMYPEVFYRLQPYIVMVCDEIDTCGGAMPTQQTVERITDSIYDDICKMYPDMKNYVEESKPEALGQPFDRDDDWRRRFRRRGLFRDLIDILLLTELFRRRRRFIW